jgi:hypothetical protein
MSLADFFRHLNQPAQSSDYSTLAAQFADPFLFAGPQGVKCFSTADFARALPQRKQLFDSLGCTSNELISLEETALNERYSLARTRWRFTFDRSPDAPQTLDVDSTFLVDTGGDAPRILLYLTHQDIFADLRERGFLPPAAHGASAS